MPKFEANMNFIPPSPSRSMKQCNKSATVKFHMELRKQSRSGATPPVSVKSEIVRVVSLSTTKISEITRLKIRSSEFGYLNPFPNDKFLDSSKLKEFADDNFKFSENGRKFFKWIENIVEKGENIRYEQFLLFPQCFQKACKAVT